jgi:hypothetical protein
MASSEAFYGFAALIIPVLLFGGAVSDRWAPKHRTDGHPAAGDPKADQSGRRRRELGPRPLAWCVLFAMAFVAVAEVAAISAVFTGRPSFVTRVLVVLAVAGGTVLAAGAVTWPWRDHIHDALFWIVTALVVAGAYFLILPTFNAIGTASPDATLSDVLQVLSDAKREEAQQLAQIANADAETQATLQRAVRLWTAEARADERGRRSCGRTWVHTFSSCQSHEHFQMSHGRSP